MMVGKEELPRISHQAIKDWSERRTKVASNIIALEYICLSQVGLTRPGQLCTEPTPM